MAEAEVVGGISLRHTPDALFAWIHDIKGTTEEIIADIPHMDDEALVQLHKQASTIEHCSWMIKAAARYELLKRAVRQRGGRGNKDLDEVGRMAVAKQVGERLRVTPRVLFEDERIIKTFFTDSEENVDGAINILSKGALPLKEREYYRAAATTDDPHTTLTTFAEQKAADDSFSTRDAWTYVKHMKTPPLDSPVEPLIEDAALKDWYKAFVELCDAAPEKPNLQRALKEIVPEIRAIVQEPAETRRQQLRRLIADGIDEQDMLAREIGVDRIWIAVWLNCMVEDYELERFSKEVREGARGQARTGYRILKKRER